MMTSNFANWNIQKFPTAISIARGTSPWFKGRIALDEPEIAGIVPSEDLVSRFKQHEIGEETYREEIYGLSGET